MNFLNAIQSCLSKWITFSGRAPRSEYWYFVLFFLLFTIVLNIIDRYLNQALAAESVALGAALLLLIASLIMLFCSLWVSLAMISVFVRRMHDTNHSGWWYWIVFTIIGAFFPLLYWKCSKGTDGDNRFGPDPLKETLIA